MRNTPFLLILAFASLFPFARTVRTQEAEVAAEPSTSNRVTINFNNLPNETVVTNQYLPHATFSGNGFSAGSRYPYGADNVAQMINYHGQPYNAAIQSRNWYYYANMHNGYNDDTYVDFKLPVNDLSFYILNSRNFYTIVYIHVWVNWQYYGAIPVQGSGYYGSQGPPIFVNLGSIRNITGLQIKPFDNYDPSYWMHLIYYDDFVFTPDLSVSITNPRVAGNLQGTKQKALVGGDVRLQAGANRGGGTYSWSVEGPHQRISTSADGTSILVRWTQTGNYRVKVTYTLNGIPSTSYVDVNVIIPTLTRFTAEKRADRIANPDVCIGLGGNEPAAYMLGCPGIPIDPANPFHIPGITFSASAQLPPGPYLSDPAQGGIKFVQLVSSLRKALLYGSAVCQTARTSEVADATGWQLDTRDPYSESSVRRFVEGATVTTQTEDSPRQAMSGGTAALSNFGDFDAYYQDEAFEMYVVYFTGTQPGSPSFQRALGFSNPNNDPNLQVAYLPWAWGGNVYFDPPPQFFTDCNDYDASYCLKSNTSTGGRVASSRACDTPTCLRTYSGNAEQLRFNRCPGGPAPATGMIDTSRYFVWRLYKDFLNRDPFNPERPDTSGLDHWRGEIAQCGFDPVCIQRKRVDVTRAFFYSQEFIGRFPILVESNRCTLPYNKEFVRQCYYNFLKRTTDPEIDDAGGFNYWVSKLNNQCPAMGDDAYNEMLRAFIESIEYRTRADFHATPPLPW